MPTAWFDLALGLVRTTPGFSPPVASRAFGYAGVALHEAIAPGITRRASFAGVLNGLTRSPGARDGAYHWPTVANSALAAILRLLFPTTPSSNITAIDELERRFAAGAQAELPFGIYKRSVARGADVARHVFDWSTTDGGHEAFRNNFPAYTPPTGPGLWVPTPPALLPALQPYWGGNRPLVLPSGETCSPSPPPTYSETEGSAFYVEAYECYRVTTDLTPEQEAIARFWSDDPSLTATPPGHWISILTQVARELHLTLDRATESYAKVGVAVADAFISCWQTKYRDNLLRPVTYIRSVIDPTWGPLLVTPPFPEYTSGHSVQSAAAAHVLTSVLGQVAFTDHTHDARGLPARSFSSFAVAAEEAAISRLYGGIHFRAAIERGLEQGACIGEHVAALT
ncbi:MAG TPA: phosphatase PAP2 family protein [Gaiellaceae bacterium]|nr:phosphatase PAP2 family protein [Gaiellaceae bacterium]